MDLGLRTGLASVIAATAGPTTLLRTSGRAQRKAVEFFADLAGSGDPASVFRPPPEVEVRARRLGRQVWAPTVGHIDLLTFPSPYEPACPDLAESFLSHSRNSIARAQHWRHPDGPRPTIVVVHGFTGSPYWFNSSFFSLPWFYGHGCDVVLVTLPFHGARNDRIAPFSGSGLFTDGLGHFHEAMLQSVCDLRVVIDYLQAGGVENVGITGLSLGGYLTALMAAVEPRLHMAIPNSAVTDLAGLIDGWFPAGHVLKVGLRQGGISEQAFRASMSLHSPLRYPSLLSTDRLFVIGGLGDRLAPPEQSARLIEHWGRPKAHWFQGSHILHVGRAHYLREIGRFLKATGFSPG
ncbi:MAG TPA: prolyl oligopeptidase family serine peptidase [Acidimicrobiales bacterium]|nr:prolyl oligopeptidase family serine peptidase [Acidimicrobiales bacterium]